MTLDIAGRIPTPQEVRAFLSDSQPDRRTLAIERLLNSPAYARHWANIWQHHFLPQADTPQFARLAPIFQTWMQDELTANTPYDRICRSMLASSRGPAGKRPFAQPVSEAAESFVAVSQGKPEILAANASRVFLGVNLDCAQCHNHPFARWTKNQFWEFAAFFAPPTVATDSQPVRFELAIPDSKKIAMPKLFTKETLAWPKNLERDTSRRLLANWITSKENPFFARNAVNRVWAQLFGRGLVEPLDDLSDSNPASHPELMEELAKAFVASGYDLKYLVRVIASTKAYQRSSKGGGKGADPNMFTRMAVRGLSGEQMFDSLRVAAGLPLVFDEVESRAEGLTPRRSPRQAFLKQFHDDRPATAQRSVLQSLELMNGKLSGEAVRGKTVMTAADAPFLDVPGRIESVFLAVLSRRPTADEAREWIALVNTADVDARREALGDLFWVLINSAEFSVNH